MGASVASLPESFGKYRILKHLATGGMAEVYLGQATGVGGFQKLLVIKQLRPELSTNAAMTAMFLDEARLSAALEHPNIAQVHDVGIVDRDYFFAMEYVHGVDLRQLMRRAHHKATPVPVAEAVYVGTCLCAALHYAHEKRDFNGKPLGIIHRDISPSNVLVSYDGTVKVCDFGIAKAAGQTKETATGVVKGKFSYMSPEQCRCEKLDRRSDVFAIAIVLYELTTLHKLFRGNSDYEVMRSVIERPVTPPTSLRPDYPPELERIVLKGLAKAREDRYETAQEMQLDLEAFASQRGHSLSAVRFASLMATLFEDRVEAWQAAQQGGVALEEHLQALGPASDPEMSPLTPSIELTLDETGDPPFPSDELPDAPPATVEATSPQRLSASHAVLVSASAAHPVVAAPAVSGAHPIVAATGNTGPVPLAPPERSLLPIGLALLLAIGGGGAMLYGRMVAHQPVALDAEAERIANAIDAQVRGQRLRAEGLAALPMLRASIATDGNTLRDMATREPFLNPAEGQTIEVFQWRGDKPASLLRLPGGAPPISATSATGATRLDLDGDGVRVVVEQQVFPMYQAPGLRGTIVVRGPVELRAIKQRLAPRVTRASLSTSGARLALVAGGVTAGAGDAVVTPVPLGDAGLPELKLEAIARGGDVAWATPAAFAAWGLALVLLLVQLARRRSPTAPSPS